MIRKIIIVVLTLAALVTGAIGLAGSAQAYLDPGRFYGPNEGPYLHWFTGSWQITSGVSLSLDRGKLGIRYCYLTEKGWVAGSDCIFQFAGFSFSVSRRHELLFTRIARTYWEQRLRDKQETAPFDPSRWASFSPTAGKPGKTGWIIHIPLLAISCVLAAYPIANAPLRRYRRRKHGRCVRCGYDLRGLTEPRCPECGDAI